MAKSPTIAATRPSAPQSGSAFLLFSGSFDRPGGGARDLAGVFRSEEAARDAFLDLRRATSSDRGWAQLVAVDHDDRLRPLCWFGVGAGDIRATPGAATPPVGVPAEVRPGRGMWPRPRRHRRVTPAARGTTRV